MRCAQGTAASLKDKAKQSFKTTKNPNLKPGTRRRLRSGDPQKERYGRPRPPAEFPPPPPRSFASIDKDCEPGESSTNLGYFSQPEPAIAYPTNPNSTRYEKTQTQSLASRSRSRRCQNEGPFLLLRKPEDRHWKGKKPKVMKMPKDRTKYDDEKRKNPSKPKTSVKQIAKCTSLHLAAGCFIDKTLWNQGIEHQPGPAWNAKDDDKYVIIESINTTALPCCAGIVTGRDTRSIQL